MNPPPTKKKIEGFKIITRVVACCCHCLINFLVTQHTTFFFKFKFKFKLFSPSTVFLKLELYKHCYYLLL